MWLYESTPCLLKPHSISVHILMFSYDGHSRYSEVFSRLFFNFLFFHIVSQSQSKLKVVGNRPRVGSSNLMHNILVVMEYSEVFVFLFKFSVQGRRGWPDMPEANSLSSSSNLTFWMITILI